MFRNWNWWIMLLFQRFHYLAGQILWLCLWRDMALGSDTRCCWEGSDNCLFEQASELIQEDSLDAWSLSCTHHRLSPQSIRRTSLGHRRRQHTFQSDTPLLSAILQICDCRWRNHHCSVVYKRWDSHQWGWSGGMSACQARSFQLRTCPPSVDALIADDHWLERKTWYFQSFWDKIAEGLKFVDGVLGAP